ncbi:hypothetical protein D8674_001936 [Pyrus ussuriensis x Pyrus communis]|uniref:Uncharacterized protein n=1 Tax=Pyrus ussuriensis x Pyrus communis TaxID=2448454 RepID=A0A5N5FGQ8_9ROSA|nr:uncharacterized protein LOC103948243 [Pyrus x bretschneideri]XP_009357529.2 uncharacterized protein LOC103948243 [Pyrus x bretschneideri]KAB2600931.1 hypothetical protein D8674_001936 [Pyrus ussuriensis x Pyrus communis]
MKKLYRKGAVHPSPPIISDHLAFLPATILTLAAALSPEDREVLAYLISCSNCSVNLSSSSSYAPPRNRTTATAKKTAAAKGGSGSGGVGGDHPARFNCDCFRCYTSYWVRWDESPNRQLIHEIIDAFEDELLTESKGFSSKTSRKERRNKSRANNGSGELKRSELSVKRKELAQSHTADQEAGGGGGEVVEEASEKGSVRRFVSFLGERIWGVWSQ